MMLNYQYYLDILDMDPKSTAVINEVIAKLQDLLGGRTSSSGPKEARIPDFDANFAKVVERSKTLPHEIQVLTDIIGQAFKLMKQILGFSSYSKKYSPQQGGKLRQKFLDLSKKTEDFEREKKNVEYIDHAKTIRQLLSVPFWVLVDTPQFLIKGSIESGDFSALKFMKKKNMDINDWYKLLQISLKSLEKYVATEYPMGISFTGSDDHWAIIIDGKGAPTTEAPKQQAPKQVEAPKPVVQVKKEKKRAMVGINLNISNYEGENIQIKAGELQMKNGVFVQSCKGSVFKIEPKFKSIVVNKCQDFTLIIGTCVSGVEIVNSSNITLIVHEKTPSISIDTSNSIKITLNEQHLGCDIVSSKTSQLTVSYEKQDGTQSKAASIAEQLITKWSAQKNKFVTSIYDAFL